MKKVALLCFDNPFLPPNEGGKLSMKTRILSLLQCNDVEIDIYMMNKPAEGVVENCIDNICDDRKWKVKSIMQFQMRFEPWMILSRYPICVNKRYNDECVRRLREKKYDVAIYEGEHMMKYRLNNDVSADKHVLYMHDVESAYRKESARGENRLLIKIAQYVESVKFKLLEKKIDNLFDVILFISDDERSKLAKNSLCPKKYVYVPAPSLCGADMYESGPRKSIILYVGDLKVSHNYLSVKWFVENVLVHINDAMPSVSMRIVGRISEEDKVTLQRLNNRVHVLGYVEDINKEYHQAAFFACPMLYGAGVKIKTIDALANGQLVVGTSKSIEGTRLKSGIHVLVEDKPHILVDKCIDVLKNREKYDYIAKAGWIFVKDNHSLGSQAVILERVINN